MSSIAIHIICNVLPSSHHIAGVTAHARKHIKIESSDAERKELLKYSTTGSHSVKLVTRAKIILELDEANGRKPLTQDQIAEKVGVTRKTVNDVTKAFL